MSGQLFPCLRRQRRLSNCLRLRSSLVIDVRGWQNSPWPTSSLRIKSYNLRRQSSSWHLKLWILYFFLKPDCLALMDPETYEKWWEVYRKRSLHLTTTTPGQSSQNPWATFSGDNWRIIWLKSPEMNDFQDAGHEPDWGWAPGRLITGFIVFLRFAVSSPVISVSSWQVSDWMKDFLSCLHYILFLRPRQNSRLLEILLKLIELPLCLSAVWTGVGKKFWAENSQTDNNLLLGKILLFVNFC